MNQRAVETDAERQRDRQREGQREKRGRPTEKQAVADKGERV